MEKVITIVNADGCLHWVTEDQLDAFLEAGWSLAEKPKKANKTK